MTQPYEGGCECGAIRYRITGEPMVVYACHCTICQTQSGSAFGMGFRVTEDQFELTKGTMKSFQRTAASGQVFTNSFCPDCGTRIYHLAERSVGMVSLKPGTLDDTGWLQASHQIFAGSAQPWVAMPEGSKVFETVPKDPKWLRGE